tara:strand:+ start:186 stop:512 length:327 start_codon:yes stop_codon:yes gene_type:complete
MSNFRDINSASRNLNRVTDVNLKPENREALEAVMVALAAGGRVQEMALIAQTLEKTSVQTDIAGAIADLKNVIQAMPQRSHDQAVEDEKQTIEKLQAEIEVLKQQNGR